MRRIKLRAKPKYEISLCYKVKDQIVVVGSNLIQRQENIFEKKKKKKKKRYKRYANFQHVQWTVTKLQMKAKSDLWLNLLHKGTMSSFVQNK